LHPYKDVLDTEPPTGIETASERIRRCAAVAIHLLDDFSNILAHHILALSGNTGKWGKNMVGKNILPIKLFADVLPCNTMR
jgi:hypothetical protein